MSQQFNTTDVLRLEVEVEPTGLTNLIANPEGALGAWGWVTPVASTTMTAPGGYLQFDPNNLVSRFWSEPMPATPGQYAAASVNLVQAVASATLQLEWLDASYAALSSTPAVTVGTGNGLRSLAPAQVPAAAAFVRFRVNFPTATSSSLRFNDVKVATAPTAAELNSSRLNLITNPSFETNITGWASVGAYATVSRSTAQAYKGAASLAITANTSVNGGDAYTVQPVNGGTDYVFQFRSRSGSYARDVSAHIKWEDANGSTVGTSDGKATKNSSSGWSLHSVMGTAPARATRGRFIISVRGALNNEVHYFDAAMVTQGTDVPAYFDGTTAASGTISYSWNGTAHASISRLSDTTIASLVPTEWRNILGPTHDIKVEREGLNIGFLTAEILDATLDPSQSANLRPGRRVRLLALEDPTGEWEPIFTGKTTELDVQYDEKAVPPKPPRVTLSAVDATQSLAAARRPEGVATIDELPYVLEGAGVPWDVNGSGNQVSTATVVSTNDNASALDQVAITRDSALGYAWVDRFGVLSAWDTPPNGIANGSFEVNASGWIAGASTTISRSTAQARSGVASMSVTRTGSIGTARVTVSNSIPVTPGMTYRVTAWVRAATVARNVTIELFYWDWDFGFAASATSVAVADTATGWTKVEFDVLAPSNAAFSNFNIDFASAGIGEVHYVDDVSLTPILNEPVYSELDLSFSSADCINSVNVTYLHYYAVAGNTEEVPLGPYEDFSSIREWGRREAEFTVHGLPGNEADVPAYAAKILARNANPSVRVNSVSFPVAQASHIGPGRALLDLYDLVRVVNADKGINQDLRIDRITHRITPEKWMVDLGFTGENTVAAPQQTPPVQNAPQGYGRVFASGQVNVVINAAASAFVDVTFPQPFDGTPVVVATSENSNYITAVRLRTASGFRLDARHYTGASTTATVPVNWVAAL